MDVLKPDICIIGGGSAGRAVAAAAAVFGVPTVLVDNGKMGGGLSRRAFCASAMSANVDNSFIVPDLFRLTWVTRAIVASGHAGRQ